MEIKTLIQTGISTALYSTLSCAIWCDLLENMLQKYCGKPQNFMPLTVYVLSAISKSSVK